MALHRPRAWLGTPFHRLMAGAPGDSGEAAALWDAAITFWKPAPGLPFRSQRRVER